MSNKVLDLNRVRFVTERFEELKGLRSVMVGCIWSVVASSASEPKASPDA